MVFHKVSAWLVQADPVVEGVLSLLGAWLWTGLAVAAVVVVARINAAAADRPRRYTVPLPKTPAGAGGGDGGGDGDGDGDDDAESAAAAVAAAARAAAAAGAPAPIACYAPGTGRFLGLVSPSTAAAIDGAVAAAKAAQAGWAQTTTFAERRRVLRTLLRHVLDNQAALCRVACLDSGKLPVDAALGEVLVVAERIRWTLAHGEAALRPSRRPGGNAWTMPHKRNTVVYEPLGVVAALVSWNYPFHNLVAPMVSALFAGNGIVVKASEQTAWSAQYFTAVVRGALVAHGHDPRLVQTVVCWPADAARLTRHPDVAHLTFIGSQPVARAVAADAAAALTPLCAELGGKDPFVVLDSVGARRLPAVAATLLRGTFQSSGQNCVGVERVIATPGVYDALLALVADKVRALRLGFQETWGENDEKDGADAEEHYDVGAMISDARFDRLEALVDGAVRGGARLLAGGRRYAHPRFPRGHYFAPTLLADVTPAMAIAREECFGPILCFMRAPDATPAAVLALAHAAPFGLGASVFGGEADPATDAVVRGLRVGMVAVNDFATYYAVQLPFGGVGGSGYGRFAGAEGLQALCNAKSVCADRWGRWGVRTALPAALRYPVPSQRRAWAFVRGLVAFGYGQTWRERWDGIVDLVRNG